MTNNNYKDDIFSDELVDLDKDAFNFDSEAEKLAQYLKRGKAPFVAAICGEWGAGKSSFLRFLHKKLKDKDNIVIYFNAWRASLHETPEISFIHELTTQLEKSNIFRKRSKKLKEVSKVLISSSIDVFSENSKILGSLYKTYKKTREKLKDEIEETIESERNLLTSFENLCALIPEDKSIYIFIDELDRCSPEITVKIIESLKKFFYGKDILYEDILDGQEEKRNNNLIKVIKYISKYIIFEIITPLFYSTNQKLKKKNEIDIPSIPFKYILALDEGYVAKAFASHYKLNKSDAMEYLSKFIQYRYCIKDYNWSKLIENVISTKNNVDEDFWTLQHIIDINHILTNAFRVYNPRTVKKIIAGIILHQSSCQKTYKQRREYLEKTFQINEQERSANFFIFKESILRATNVFWVIDSCIQELYQSEMKWYLNYGVFKKLPETSSLIERSQSIARNKNINWAVVFFNGNYKIPESELKQNNGQIKKNSELMAFSISQSIGHINEICLGLKINNYGYPHEYFKDLFKHLINNEWNQINQTLFSR